MNSRVIAVALAALLLGGCTAAEWDHATTYVGLGDDDQAAPQNAAPAEPQRAAPAETASAAPSAPAALGPAPNDMCRQMARAERDDAASNGFDAATQQRRAEASYRQCLGSAAR